MKLHGMIAGMSSDGRFVTLTQSQGLLKYISEYGADNPARAIEYIDSMVKGFEILSGYSEEPQNNFPLTVRYAPLHLSGKDEYFEGTQPFYVLRIEGEDYRSGKKSYEYQQTVFLDKQQMLTDPDGSCLDYLLGILPVKSQQMDLLRQKKANFETTVSGGKCAPVLTPEDSGVVFAAAEALLSGRRVAIRLDRKGAFNDRAFSLLGQIYSLLPPRLAVESGFASYVEPTDVRRIGDLTGIKLFLLPAGESLDFVDKNAVVLDLNNPDSMPACSDAMAKCMTAWARVTPEERIEGIRGLFANVKSWDAQTYMRLTREFFTDPFFQYKPTVQNLTTLEDLRAQFDKCMVFRYDIGWITKQLRLYVRQIMAPNVNLLKLKAEAVVKARSAKDDADRRKYTELYRFADLIAPGDASSFAVVQTQNMLAEECRTKVDEEIRKAKEEVTQLQKKTQQMEQDLEKEKSALQMASNKALSDQKIAHEKALAEAKSAHQKALTEEKSAHQKALAAQKTAHDKALSDAKKAHSEELSRAKAGSLSNNQQVLGLQKQLQDERAAHAAEVRKLREQAGKGMSADAQKEIEALKKAHADEVRKLRAQKSAAAPMSGSARAVSQQAKQVIAQQFLQNLAETERMRDRQTALEQLG